MQLMVNELINIYFTLRGCSYRGECRTLWDKREQAAYIWREGIKQAEDNPKELQM